MCRSGRTLPGGDGGGRPGIGGEAIGSRPFPYTVPVVIACLVAGGFAYLALTKPKDAGGGAGVAMRASDAGSCTGQTLSRVLQAALRARYQHALGLVKDRQFDVALSELRDVATI